MSDHRDGAPCVPFDQCPICLAKRKEAREVFINAQPFGVNFLSTRVAWHLGNGCDSPEKARELALKEWRVGVLGEVVP